MQRGLLAVLAGLACCVGPALVFAQDFIDVEAERARAATAAETTPAPAVAFPASAPDRPSVEPSQPTNSAPAATAGGSGNLAELFYQLQVLQQEVRQLHGQMEDQAHQIRQLRQQSLERYMDMDRRLSGAAGTGSSELSGAAGATSQSPAEAVALPGEEDAYRAAYALLVGQEFDQAVAAFKQFLLDYPNGRFAPNAYYWLGELYLVIDPRDLEASRQSFTLLLEQYPGNSKEADARYKLGVVYFEKGNAEVARQHLDRVLQEQDSNSSVAKLTRDFIAENY